MTINFGINAVTLMSGVLLSIAEQEAVINDKIRTNNMVDKEKSTRDCTIMVLSLACPNIK